MHKVEDLKIWQKSIALTKWVYEIVAALPTHEKYGLTSQIKRSSVSIPSNIAEGAGRNTNKDFSRFIAIALGSAFELETQFIIASELNFIDTKDIEELNLRLNKIQKMLVNFQKHLNNEK